MIQQREQNTGETRISTVTVVISMIDESANYLVNPLIDWSLKCHKRLINYLPAWHVLPTIIFTFVWHSSSRSCTNKPTNKPLFIGATVLYMRLTKFSFSPCRKSMEGCRAPHAPACLQSVQTESRHFHGILLDHSQLHLHKNRHYYAYTHTNIRAHSGLLTATAESGPRSPWAWGLWTVVIL